MQPVSIIAFFCEDIREEKSGQDTLIGILPDNLRVPSVPGALPKCGVYLRVHLPRDTPIRSIKSRAELPDGTSFDLASLDDAIERAKADAKTHDLPYLGIVSKALFAPLPIPNVGRIQIIANIEGEESVCGVLNLSLVPSGTDT